MNTFLLVCNDKNMPEYGEISNVWPKSMKGELKGRLEKAELKRKEFRLLKKNLSDSQILKARRKQYKVLKNDKFETRTGKIWAGGVWQDAPDWEQDTISAERID